MNNIKIYHRNPVSRINWLNVKDNPPPSDGNCCYLCYTNAGGYAWWGLCLYSDGEFHLPGEECELCGEECYDCEKHSCDKVMPAEWYIPLDEYARPRKKEL